MTSGRVVGLGRKPEPDCRFVFLVGAAQERRQPGRASDDEREHACRERIERPGMADPRRAERPPDPRHDVMRRRTGRFVDDQDTVKSAFSSQTSDFSSQTQLSARLQAQRAE